MSFDELLSKREDHPFIAQDKEFMTRATAPTGSPSVGDVKAPKILRILNLMELELRAEAQKALAKSSESRLPSPQSLLPETPSTAHCEHDSGSVEHSSNVTEGIGRDAELGARRWVCPPPCGKSFTREHHLPRHMKSSSCLHNQSKRLEIPRKLGIRNSDPVPQSSGRNAKRKRFSLPAVQAGHEGRLRSSDGKLICPACEMTFSRNDHLKRHQNVSCKGVKTVRTRRSKPIHNSALLKGAVSRAHKWLASIDSDVTKDGSSAERLSPSDLGILGLGGCSEEDEAFRCPGCSDQFDRLELVVRHICAGTCQKGTDVAAPVKEEQTLVLPKRSYGTRSLTLKRSRTVPDDDYPVGSVERGPNEGIQPKDTSESKFASSSRASTSLPSAMVRKWQNRSQRTKASRQITKRAPSIGNPKSQSEGTEINDLESEDETLIDAKYKR